MTEEKFKLTPIPKNKRWIFIEFAEQREKRLKKLIEEDREWKIVR